MDFIESASQYFAKVLEGNEPYASYATYFPKMIEGLGLTIELVVLSIIIGGLIAIPTALLRTSRHKILVAPAYIFIFFFRGTPLLVQLFLIYYGLAQFETVRESGWLWNQILSSPYWCGIIAFSLNTAAYTAELFSGAMRAVPKGEVEAAKSLGLSKNFVWTRIIFPRAFRIILPAYSNEIILMIKASALASTITLLDLTGMARNIISRTYMTMEFFILAGIFYLVLTWVVLILFKWINSKINRHLLANGA